MKRLISFFLLAVLSVSSPLGFAADKKISQLTTASPLTGPDELPINQSGSTKKATMTMVDTFLGVTTHKNDATIHRSINDGTSSATGLWSSSKITTELGLKANTSHNHSAVDVTSGILSVLRGGTGLGTITANKILYGSATDTFGELSTGSSLNISGGTLSVVDNTSTQKVVVSKAGTGIGTRQNLNFIEGTGITITTADNSGSDRVDVTIASASSSSYPKGYLNGPAPVYATVNTITLKTGLKARNSTDTANIELVSDVTVDLSLSGAGGRCDGTDAASTWFYVYLLKKSSDNTVSACASTVNETSSGTITYPTGYDMKRQLPMAIRNNASSNILNFYIANWGQSPTIYYVVEFPAHTTDALGDTRVLDNGNAATFAALSLASYVPPISTAALLHATQTSVGTMLYLRPTGSSMTNGMALRFYDEASYTNIPVSTNSSQSVDYKTTSTRADIAVVGYTVNTGNF